MYYTDRDFHQPESSFLLVINYEASVKLLSVNGKNLAWQHRNYSVRGKE